MLFAVRFVRGEAASFLSADFARFHIGSFLIKQKSALYDLQDWACEAVENGLLDLFPITSKVRIDYLKISVKPTLFLCLLQAALTPFHPTQL